MKVPSVADMHKGLLEMLNERADVEPVILSAKAGMGGLDLALRVDGDDRYLLDPVAAGGDTRILTHKLTRQTIEKLQPLPVEALGEPGREGDAARLDVARHYGSDVQEALDAAIELPGPDWTLTRALGPTPRAPLLVVRDAHRLQTNLLWELRELASGRVRLLMITNDAHRGALNDTQAPFYGNGVWIEMPTLAITTWKMRLENSRVQISYESLRDLLGRVRERTGVALEVFERAADVSPASLGSAWFEAVGARMGEARQLVSLAGSIHELAPRLLLTLAVGQGPYAAMPNERSDRIALALSRLLEHDLIEQPAKREWQISDPLMHAALARLRDHAGVLEGN